MIYVKITATTVPYLQDDVGTLIEFNEFNQSSVEIIETEEQSLDFELIEDNQPIYKGQFSSMNVTLLEEIEVTLDALLKDKVIKKKDKQTLLAKLSRGKSKSDKKAKSNKKEKPALKGKVKLSPIKLVLLLLVGVIILLIGLFPSFIPDTVQSMATIVKQEPKKDKVKPKVKQPKDLKLVEKITDETTQAEVIELIDQAMKEKDYSQIKEINDKYPTLYGLFEDAFFKKEWDKVIDTPLNSLTDDQKVKVAIAFLEINEVDKAIDLNNILKSDLISQKVEEHLTNQALEFIRSGKIKEAEKVNDTLKSKAIADLIEEGKAYVSLIKKYEDSKDKDGVDYWTRILANLGKK